MLFSERLEALLENHPASKKKLGRFETEKGERGEVGPGGGIKIYMDSLGSGTRNIDKGKTRKGRGGGGTRNNR